MKATEHNNKLTSCKITEAYSGTCNLNTNAWLNSGSVVEWVVVNGICYLHYVLVIRGTSDNAELATGMPAPKTYIHCLAPVWSTTAGSQCQLMISGNTMNGHIKPGTYAGTIAYAVQ